MTTRSDVAQMIDHTLLKPESTDQDVRALIAQAQELGTYSVCVSPSMLPIDAPEGLHVACVCGFPSGAHTIPVCLLDQRKVHDHVNLVSTVTNGLSSFSGFHLGLVRADIAAVRAACPDSVLKVIIESAVLTDEEIVETCKQAEAAGADFVKTSTGFHPSGGASVHAVELMRQTVGDRLGVKASGGIRDAQSALAMIEAGASRLGLSSSAAVLDGLDD